MKLYKVKNRVPELDTKTCICINNRLWNRDKIQVINGGKEFLAPKYYAAQHVSQKDYTTLKKGRYRAQKPLKNIRKYDKTKQTRYDFHAYYLTEEQYNQMYEFFYTKVKPQAMRKMKTVEDLKNEELKRKRRK